MKKSYDLSKLDLNHFAENVWHIRAVYEDMVKHGRIGKFSFAHEDQYEHGAYRSVYYENQAITDMAYEFTMGFDDENPDRDQFIDKYGCDYDDAIIAFAEERLPKIFDCKTENIEQADAKEYARKVAYFSVIADRAYKRLQEDHKLDNKKPVVTFLQYTDFIGDMAHEFSNISELCFKNDIHFEAENFATERILNRYGNDEWLTKEIISEAAKYRTESDKKVICAYLKTLGFITTEVKPHIDLVDETISNEVTTEVWNKMYDSMETLIKAVIDRIESILDHSESQYKQSLIENLHTRKVQRWIEEHRKQVAEMFEAD